MTTATEPDNGGRRSEPAALRNREPIFGVLAPLLNAPLIPVGAMPAGAIIETAAGTGTHACWFAPRFPDRPWLATDRDAANVAAIEARIAAEPSPNLLAPCCANVGDDGWDDNVATAVAGGAAGGAIAAILNINMIHIAPWAAGQGLIAGAGRLLAPGGLLFLYGPYRIDGSHTGAGNVAFDASLRERNPAWGIRELDDVTDLAASHGLRREAVVAMPADNRSVVFRRRS